MIDCAGKAILPGLVDGRVFIARAGRRSTAKRPRQASRAAAAGGVTSIVMMPDNDPAIDNVAGSSSCCARARHGRRSTSSRSRHHWQGLSGSEMTEFGLLREAGAVALTDGRQPDRQCAGDAPGADLCARISAR